MLIEERMEFDSDPETVWKRVSDVEEIPRYWHGTKSIEVVGRDGKGAITAKVKFAFGGSGMVEISADGQSRTLLLNYLSGPFSGTQRISVVRNSIEAKWDIEFKGLFRIASSWNEGHFRSGTVHALERLSKGP